MLSRLLWWAAACCCCCDVGATEYVIGGWAPGSADDFLDEWRPLLEAHLTEAVGRKRSPPITFRLVAVDYSDETSYRFMIERGELDFMCEHRLAFLHPVARADPRRRPHARRPGLRGGKIRV